MLTHRVGQRLTPSAQGLQLGLGNGGAHVSKLFSEYVDDVVLDFVVDFHQTVVNEAVLVALLSCDKCWIAARRRWERGHVTFYRRMRSTITHGT